MASKRSDWVGLVCLSLIGLVLTISVGAMMVGAYQDGEALRAEYHEAIYHK